jgi:uncharacterized NAD-dependent epimerase/dehydratase family protein
MKKCLLDALKYGLEIDSGLFERLIDHKEVMSFAKKRKTVINDIRYPDIPAYALPGGETIEGVESIIILVLGSDKNVGAELTAINVNDYLREAGYKTVLIGTTILSWMLGVRNCVFQNSIPNEFAASSLVNMISRVWEENKPHFIILEGTGGLLNPAAPSGLELLVPGRPDIIILQYPAARKFYSGTNEVSIHSIQRQIRAIEAVSGKSVSAIALYNENAAQTDFNLLLRKVKMEIDLPVYEANENGIKKLVKYLGNISGRLNYKKVKFQRRKLPAG